jgi:Methyltransferase FkbM domain
MLAMASLSARGPDAATANVTRRARRALGAGLRDVVEASGRTWRIPFGPASGMRFEFDSHLPLAFWFGIYEFEIARHLRSLCSPGYTGFDIGSYNGYYALLLARLTGERVIAFESVADACRAIMRNCGANPNLGRLVDVHHAYVAFEANAAVNAVTLDELVQSGRLPVPDLIKVDVDRAEGSVLAGAKGILVERQPHLIVETHSPELERECGELLLAAGYAPQVVSQRRWLRENRPIAHNRWLVARGAD